jgi:hypothetical protein
MGISAILDSSEVISFQLRVFSAILHMRIEAYSSLCWYSKWKYIQKLNGKFVESPVGSFAYLDVLSEVPKRIFREIFLIILDHKLVKICWESWNLRLGQIFKSGNCQPADYQLLFLSSSITRARSYFICFYEVILKFCGDFQLRNLVIFMIFIQVLISTTTALLGRHSNSKSFWPWLSQFLALVVSN